MRESPSAGVSSSDIQKVEYACRGLRVVLSDAGSIPAASTNFILIFQGVLREGRDWSGKGEETLRKEGDDKGPGSKTHDRTRDEEQVTRKSNTPLQNSH